MGRNVGMWITRLLIAGVVMATSFAGFQMQGQAPGNRTGEEMMKHASGSFEVKIAPTESSAIGKEGGIGRMTIDKVLSGDLAGTTKGEMMTTSTEGTGAMAYVALETVTATLAGHSGTFVLMHQATMNKNDPKSAMLKVTVVPGSGTGGLAGISGTFEIQIDSAGKHSYRFDYELP